MRELTANVQIPLKKNTRESNLKGKQFFLRQHGAILLVIIAFDVV